MTEQNQNIHLPESDALNTAVNLIKQSKNIIFITGAGISVSCGIPDFRSPGGLYDTLRAAGLNPPELVFDLDAFEASPEIFYRFAGMLAPDNIQPSITHRFLSSVEQNNKLLRVYTQNIDGLESKVSLYFFPFLAFTLTLFHAIYNYFLLLFFDIRLEFLNLFVVMVLLKHLLAGSATKESIPKRFSRRFVKKKSRTAKTAQIQTILA